MVKMIKTIQTGKPSDILKVKRAKAETRMKALRARHATLSTSLVHGDIAVKYFTEKSRMTVAMYADYVTDTYETQDQMTKVNKAISRLANTIAKFGKKK